MRKVITCVILICFLFPCLAGCGNKKIVTEDIPLNKNDNESTPVEVNSEETVKKPDSPIVISETKDEKLNEGNSESSEIVTDYSQDIELIIPEYTGRLRTGMFNYISIVFEDWNSGFSTGEYTHFFSNAALRLYKSSLTPDYMYVGTNGYFCSHSRGANIVGSELKDFVSDMDETISSGELSELLGIKLVNYQGPQAEDGFINWFGESLYTLRCGENTGTFAVYVYSPLSNPVNSDCILSNDSVIVFVNVDRIMYFDPLGSIKMDSWLDNSELIFSMERCPFIGLSYDEEGLKHKANHKSGMAEIGYTDPRTGWKYLIYDFGLDGTKISDKSIVSQLTLPAKDFFPDMPEKMTRDDFIERYAKVKDYTLSERVYWGQMFEGELLFVDDMIGCYDYPEAFDMSDFSFIGAIITIFAEDNKFVYSNTEIMIERFMAWEY